MKGRVIALDSTAEGACAAALVVNGRLEDLLIDPPPGAPRPFAGEIFAATVTRRPRGPAAFCVLDGGLQGYLRDAGSLREGARLLVQVLSLPEPGKLLTLTTRLLYKGPRLILTPGAPGVNVSRRIGNTAERARLEAEVGALLAATPGLDPGAGVIVRTEARGEPADALGPELAALAAACAADAARLADPAAAPEAAARTGGALAAALRDWALPLPDAVLAAPGAVDALAAARRTGAAGPLAFWGDARLADRLRPEREPFEAFGLWDEIARLRAPEHPLESGRLTVEPTRALVAVDVDTGGDFSPAAALKANLAAARELPRQLRLRGLGGAVAVDFAPLPKPQRRAVEEALRKAFRADPVETALAGWTPLGHYELQRKRERWPLTELLP